MHQVNETVLLPEDVQILEKLLKYAGEKKSDVEKSFSKFTNMGTFGLIWDSKAPEKNKWLFHFFTLKMSDRRYVLEEIDKYIKLYEEIVDGILKVKNPAKLSDAERESPLEIINELFDKLKECLKVAMISKRDTESSAIYNLHMVFIQQYDKLESLIIEADNAAIKKAIWEAVTKAKQTNERINVIERKLGLSEKRYDKLCVKYEQRYVNLKERIEEVTERNKKLCNEHVKILARNEDLLSRINDRKNETKAHLETLRAFDQRNEEKMANLRGRIQRKIEEKKNLELKVEEMKRKNMDELEEDPMSKEALEKPVQETAEGFCYANTESKETRESENICLN